MDRKLTRFFLSFFSFVHHFYPAYGFPLVEYVRLLETRAEPLLVRDNLASISGWEEEELRQDEAAGAAAESKSKNGWGLAGQWLQSPLSRENNNTMATTDG